MSDERKPVICPWCGSEMELDGPTDDGWYAGKWDSDGYHCATCGGCSGGVYACETKEEAEQLAYDAATRTPPNLPLTLPSLFELEEDDAVWVVSKNGRIWAMGAERAQEWASEERALFFAAKPTAADIEAARAEKGEGGQ